METELRKLPDLRCRDWFPSEMNLDNDLHRTELKHFQISSTAVETAFFEKSIEFE